jgi:hypothetical protein
VEPQWDSDVPVVYRAFSGDLYKDATSYLSIVVGLIVYKVCECGVHVCGVGVSVDEQILQLYPYERYKTNYKEKMMQRK